MSEELAALDRQCTWELVPLPSHVVLITSKWVFKIKTKSDGSIERYKAFPKESTESNERSQGYFPSDWKGQFGLPFKEHERIMEIATFKNFATISITDKNSIIPEDTIGKKMTDDENEITTFEN